MLDDAKLNIDNAISLRPRFAGAHSALGTIYKEKGLLTESLEEYKKAVDLGPDNPDFRLNPGCYDSLGVTYMKMGDKDAAIKSWEKALEIDPEFEKAKKWLWTCKK